MSTFLEGHFLVLSTSGLPCSLCVAPPGSKLEAGSCLLVTGGFLSRASASGEIPEIHCTALLPNSCPHCFFFFFFFLECLFFSLNGSLCKGDSLLEGKQEPIGVEHRRMDSVALHGKHGVSFILFWGC